MTCTIVLLFLENRIEIGWPHGLPERLGIRAVNRVG